MIHYCINSILCSGLFFCMYKLLLEREKLHVFKRFYLLLALISSLIVPLITLYFPANTAPAVPYAASEPVAFIMDAASTPAAAQTDMAFWLAGVYLAGLIVGLFRLVKTLYYFLSIRGAATLSFNGARLVLLDKAVAPHSFLNTVFLERKAYLEGRIEQEVLIHEWAHVRQGHSWDVLLVQLIRCIFWFNPFLYLYLRAIQLNHEFLADEVSVRSAANTYSYQQLLLRKASENSPGALASAFNFSIIKKRIVMIAKQRSPQAAAVKKLVTIPLFLMIAFLFTRKETTAQTVEPPKTKTAVPSTKEGASQEVLKEYETIVARHKKTDDKGRTFYTDFSAEEQARLLTLYKMMSAEQQQKQVVAFMPKPPLKKQKRPTQAQLNAWTDAGKYFVRIDGWKIKNSQLAKRKASDFYYHEIYKPNKGSTDYGKYDAQITLITNEGHARGVKEWNNSPEFLIGFRMLN